MEATMLQRWIQTCREAVTNCRRLGLALRHPDAPGWLKLGTGLLLLYVVSPLDRVPDVIPILGWIDDLMLIPMATSYMLERLPPAILAAVEQQLALHR
jgi:uncharacterized membrane protein YkvA (DUF1232 family)